MAVNEYLKRVYGGSARSYFERAEKALLSGERLFTVTANPEIIMHADRDPKIKKLLLSPDAEIIPDGISVVKAMNTLGCEASERITGVDLAAHLLKAAGENGKSVYLLGAKEEVVSALAEKLRAEHPDITVNYHNGYDGDKDVIFDEIAALAPDLVLVGLGCAPIYPCVIHSTPDHFGPERSQALIGVQMASAYVGVCVMPPLFGVIASRFSAALLPLYLLAVLALMVLTHERLLRVSRSSQGK